MELAIFDYFIMSNILYARLKWNLRESGKLRVCKKMRNEFSRVPLELACLWG